MRPRTRRRLVTLQLLAVGAVLAPGGAAAAEPGPPGGWAAVAQYVEMIPTTTGGKPAGGAGPTTSLPKSLATQFARRGGTDAKALETLVTSSGWGARRTRQVTPAAKPKPPREPELGVLAVPPPQQGVSVPDSVGDAFADGGRATFAIVALVVLLAAFALARLRRSAR